MLIIYEIPYCSKKKRDVHAAEIFELIIFINRRLDKNIKKFINCKSILQNY